MTAGRLRGLGGFLRFEGLAVWDAEAGCCRVEQGVRPVICLSLNDVKKGGGEHAYGVPQGKMAAEYQRHGRGVVMRTFAAA